MTKGSPESVLVGVAAYRKEDWPVIRALCPDLPKSYAYWERETQKVIDHLKGEGFRVERIELTVDMLRDWSRRRGRRLTAKVRTTMVTDLARQRYGPPEVATGATEDSDIERKDSRPPIIEWKR